jgi:HAD superfamily hydrolase (TIGR01458 family)
VAAPLSFETPPALLLDIDGVLHVGEDPIPGSVEALAELREIASGLRLVTNTTSRSRSEVVSRLQKVGFELSVDEVLTPAAMAVTYCAEHDYKHVKLLVSESLREDLEGIDELADGETVEAVILGDLGDDFNAAVLNDAFRALLDGAELIALQHNRYWRHHDGMRLDVGAYAAALEFATQTKATVLGKPSPDFFAAALAELDAEAKNAVMVGDDIEADVSGAQAAGLDGVLVRTGKFREGAVTDRGFGPSATIDSIADLPQLLRDSIER